MSQAGKSVYRFGEFDLKVDSRQLVRQGERVPLGSKAFEVLLQLVRRAGEVVPKDELLRAVWPASFVEERNLTQQVSSLRKAFGDKAGYIVTVPGRGYQFTASVVEIPAETLLQRLDPVKMAEAGATGLATEQPAGLVHTLHERTEVTFEESAYLAFRGRRMAAKGGLWWYALAGCILLTIGVWVGWRISQRPAPVDHRLVVLADFANGTSDASFGQTLKRALAIDLDQSPFVEVLGDREVVQTLQLMERKGDTPLTPDVAREVCERANRQVLLAGGVTAVGSKYLLTLEATDCNTGKRLASAKAEAPTREDVLKALDSVAEHVRRELGESAESVASYQVPIAQATTASLEALKMFSIGSYLFSQGKDENETIPFYQKAIELDPQFAMAYSALAGQYYNKEAFDLASQNNAKAFALSDHVSARERLIIQAHYYGEGLNDMQNGIKTYKIWADTYPHDFVPFGNLCNLYIALGQYDLAIEAGKKALELQKQRGIVYSLLAIALMRAGRYAEAKALGVEAKANQVDTGRLHATLFAVAVAEKDQAAIAQERAWAANHKSDWYAWFFPAEDATFLASTGRYKDARELFRKSIAMANEEKNFNVAYDVMSEEAKTEAAFGLVNAARESLKMSEPAATISADFAVSSVEVGDTGPAERYLQEHGKSTTDTVITYLYAPRIRAALAIHRDRPQEAVDTLEASRPYQWINYDIPMLRAEAYLKSGQAANAAQQYQEVLAKPGVDPTEYQYPFAHLGLARAYAQTGNLAGSRAEYKAFLDAWKDADTDLPVLQAAKAELERLH
jgi:DNA-binding winged helix-turn-helix (wHTH) protein/tetratricopeptide (TPR) repeat protein